MVAADVARGRGPRAVARVGPRQLGRVARRGVPRGGVRGVARRDRFERQKRLVPDDDAPALLQPAVACAYAREEEAPDAPDFMAWPLAGRGSMVFRKARHARPEHWLYALATLQLASDYGGRGLYGSSRGVWGAGIGSGRAADRTTSLVVRGVGAVAEWRAAVRAYAAFRAACDGPAVVASNDFEVTPFTRGTRAAAAAMLGTAATGPGVGSAQGARLLWAVWDGSRSLSWPEVHPLFVPCARAVRLAWRGGRIVARLGATKARAVSPAPFPDPLSPHQRALPEEGAV